MKRIILILCLLIPVVGLSQFRPNLPSGSETLGTSIFMSPDSSLYTGRPGLYSYIFNRNVGKFLGLDNTGTPMSSLSIDANSFTDNNVTSLMYANASSSGLPIGTDSIGGPLLNMVVPNGPGFSRAQIFLHRTLTFPDRGDALFWRSSLGNTEEWTSWSRVASRKWVNDTLNSSLSLSGDKVFNGSVSVIQPSPVSYVPVENEIKIGRTESGAYIGIGGEGDVASVILRSFSSSGTQLTLSEGGIDIPKGGVTYGIKFGGDVGIRQSASGNLLLSGASSGNEIYLRPNGTTSATGEVVILPNGAIVASQFRMNALSTAPSSSTDTGTLGQIRITEDYIYVCIATDTWVRAALSTW